MRVYHVVNSFSDSSFSVDLCSALELHTNTTPILVPLYEKSKLNGTHPLTIRYLDYDKPLSRRIYQLLEFLTSDDICHLHHNRSGMWLKFAGKIGEFPVIKTEHNNHRGYHKFSRIINGISNPFADAVVCVSDSVKDSLYDWEQSILTEKKLRVIYNGVPMHRIDQDNTVDYNLYEELSISPCATVVGSAGMHSVQKGYDVLIHAIKRINQQTQDPVELVLPGTGDQTSKLKSITKKLNIGSRVHFAGYLPTRDHIYDLMRQLDIFAMPSRWEGHSIAALEAMAQGVPCVFSDIPSFTKVFDDVALFHEVDNIPALSSTLLELVHDPNLRSSLGNAGQSLVENKYTMANTAQEYHALYQSIH